MDTNFKKLIKLNLNVQKITRHINTKRVKYMVNLDLSNVNCVLDLNKYSEYIKKFEEWCKKEKESPKGMIGWLNYCSRLDTAELDRIETVAKDIRSKFDTLVVVGIGGSYIGARSMIEAVKGLYSKEPIELIYLGNTLSAKYTKQILSYLEKKKFAVLVISKSGKTLETTIAFRLLKQLLKNKLGEHFVNAVYIVTDEHNGNLLDEAKYCGYETFYIPSDIGGRYSVITPVGLLPMAVAGVNIREFVQGAINAEKILSSSDLTKNQSYQYAVMRNILHKDGKAIELFVTYEPQVRRMCEWLKQLFGESEGKNKKGIFPASAVFSTDLHSLGQFIQDGNQCLFETVLNTTERDDEFVVPKEGKDFEELNHMAGKPVSEINQIIFKSVLKAHASQGKVPNIVFNIDKLDEYHLGYLIYFFMKACAFLAFIQGVYPFDQPGVEVYQENAHALLKNEE